MRIGVDAGCWLNSRGYGRFARELLPVMCAQAEDSDRFVFFLDETTHAAFDVAGENVERVIVPLTESPSDAAVTGGNRRLVDLFKLSRAVAREELDVLFFPSVYSFFPVPPGLGVVVTLHDTIAERHPELTLPTLHDRVFWRLKVGLAIRQARLVLTVSHFSAGEIAAVYGVPESNLRVAEEAPASSYHPPESQQEVRDAARRVGLPAGARWFTYVGGFNPHKRIDILVRAHARLVNDPSASSPYLVLVGERDDERFHANREEILGIIADEGTSEYVIWTGFVPDEELRLLHAGALALVLPSETEGFGLPAVEAAACGTPVVATERSPLPDLLQGGGIFVTPGRTDALTKALRRMAEDEESRKAMGREARRRAAALSWERSARQTLSALRAAAG